MRQDRPKERVPTKIGSSTNPSKSAKDLRGEDENVMHAEINMSAKRVVWSYGVSFGLVCIRLWIDLRFCQRLVRCWKCLDLAISPDKTLLDVFGISIYVGESAILYEWSFAKYQCHSTVVPSVFAQWTQGPWSPIQTTIGRNSRLERKREHWRRVTSPQSSLLYDRNVFMLGNTLSKGGDERNWRCHVITPVQRECSLKL